MDKALKSLQLKQTLNNLLNDIITLGDFQAVGLFLKYRSTNILTNFTYNRSSPLSNSLMKKAEEISGLTAKELKIPLSEEKNIIVKVVKSGKLLTTKNILDLIRPLANKTTASAVQKVLKTKSMAVVPLAIRGKIKGVLVVSSQKKEITKKEIELLSFLASQATLAIENAHLYGLLQERHLELEELRERLKKKLTKKTETMQQALRESEAKYRIVADNTYDWEFWLNPQGKFIYVSPSCKRITGFKAEEFMANPNLFYRIIHPDDRPHYKDHRQEVEDKKMSGEVEFRLISRDGTLAHIHHVCQPVFDRDGNYLGTRGSNRDITERKKAEEALRVSRSRFRDLTEHTSDWLWEIDENGNYVYTSPKVKELLGYKSEEVIGRPLLGFMSPKEEKRVAPKFQAAIDSRKPFAGLANINLCKDGGIVILETSGVPIFDAEGNFRGYRGIDRDITERKKMEQTLHKKREADQKETMKKIIAAQEDERKRIASDMHDRLAQLLKATSFYLQAHKIGSKNISASKKAELEKIQDLLGQSIEETRKIFTEIRVPDIDRMGLITTLKNYLNIVEEENELNINLSADQKEYRLSPEIETAIYRIIKEAILNAQRHGKVKNIGVKFQREDKRIKVEIKDDGVGFDLEKVDKSQYNLGLVSMRERAKILEGTLEIKSKPGKGTKILMSFPC